MLAHSQPPDDPDVLQFNSIRNIDSDVLAWAQAVHGPWPSPQLEWGRSKLAGRGEHGFHPLKLAAIYADRAEA
jgi:hypothetical protein